VPVQILRNGMRAVVFGSGDINELALRYMPISSDIQTGDVLVTSGIDGTYPAGLPVAKVVKIERDPAYPFAKVVCMPMAGVDRHRYLLIVSGVQELPPRPDPAQILAEEKAKNASKRKAQ
jgi:rod shape-determining protein MreC